jgi:hypothetical protein
LAPLDARRSQNTSRHLTAPFSRRSAFSSGISLGRKNELPSEDLKEWYDEFTLLSEAGRYFFSSNRQIFRASKPGR